MQRRLCVLLFMMVCAFEKLCGENDLNTNIHYCIVVCVTAQEGQVDNLRAELKKIQELSRQESTCLQYDVIESDDTVGRFALYEKWIDKENHALQFKKTYIVSFIEKMPELIDQSSIVYIAGNNE